MTVWKRAWYYITRKRDKTMVMLTILMLILILLTTVLTMQKAMGEKKEADEGSGIVLTEQGKDSVPQTKDEILQQFAEESNAKALEKESRTMQSLFRIMVFVLIGMSVLILSALLTFRIRERKYEIGVMISIGRSKMEIIGQFLTEMLFLTGMALPPALGISAVVVKLLGAGFSAVCILEAFGIWAGTILIALVIASLGIVTKNARTILAQID